MKTAIKVICLGLITLVSIPSPLQALTFNFSKYFKTRSSMESPIRYQTFNRQFSFPRIKLTPTPTITPSPTPTFKAKITPTTTPAPTSLPDKLLSQINAYRASHGKSPAMSETYTCNFARTRASEITTNFSHDGFQSRIDNKTLPYPGYSTVTENLAMTSNSDEVVDLWKNSPGHAANMIADTTHICVQNSGNYYVMAGWKP